MQLDVELRRKEPPTNSVVLSARRGIAMFNCSLRALVFFAFFATAIPLEAQSTAIQQTAPCTADPPKQLPYIAEIRTHKVQTLADGTTITRDGKEVQARDTQGRWMSSRSGNQMFAGSAMFDGENIDSMTWGDAEDPVEGIRAHWNSRTMKAQLIRLPPPGSRFGCWSSGSFSMSYGPKPSQLAVVSPSSIRSGPSASTGSRPPLRPARPMPAVEDLGTSTIAGLEAHGHRATTTTAIGQMGNDQPLVRVNETWFAPGIAIPLRQITRDPLNGTETQEVVSLDLSEPPASTFQPPEGYEIQIEEMHEVPCQQ
jgi:hypothetical protein